MIPSRAQSFQDRAEAGRLRSVLASGGTAVQCQVLTGTGGVGKTQMAADFARTAWESGAVDVLVWVTASTRSALVSGYAQAGVEVCAADPGNPEEAAKTFLAWLEPKSATQPCRWLVVLDDITDPAELYGLWPPTAAHGRTMATTRRREAALTGQGRHLVQVGVFTPTEAAAYLTAALAAHDRHEPAGDLAALAGDLGHLPLALSQAAAYLIDASIDTAAYRRQLADKKQALASLLPEPGSLPDGQVTTLAAAWSLSLERADQLRPVGLARPMLQLIAMLDPDGIPAAVLASQPAFNYLSEQPRREWWKEPSQVTTAHEVQGALRALHRLSLIDHTPRTPQQAVRVHQLIQRATVDALDPDERGHLARTAADALTAAWPDIERDTLLAQALRASTVALVAQAQDALWQPDYVHAVLFRFGTSLGESGQVVAAIQHFHDLALRSRQHRGPDHLGTLNARAYLAHWRGTAGDAVGAVTAFEQLLADELRVLGPDHVVTLVSRHNLARWRGEAGDAVGAVTAFEQVLADKLRVLGPDHLETLGARSYLARWRGEAGDAVGAVTAFEQLLADHLRVLGPDHLDTLVSRHNLAYWRGTAGDAVGAVTAFEQLLADHLRVLGPDHLETLITRSNVARWRGEAGDAVGAVTAFEQVLADELRVLGPDHLETLISRHNLAYWRGETGDAVGAVTAFEQLLADHLRVLDPDHPQVLTTRTNLARWRGRAEGGGSSGVG